MSALLYWFSRSGTMSLHQFLSISTVGNVSYIIVCRGVCPLHGEIFSSFYGGVPGGASGKEPACQCRRCRRCEFDPWVRKIPWRRAWQPTPVFLPGESHGQGAWRATAHRVTKNQTQLKQLSMHASGKEIRTVSAGRKRACRSTHSHFKPAPNWHLSRSYILLARATHKAKAWRNELSPPMGGSYKVTSAGGEYSKGRRIRTTVAVKLP